MIRFVTRDGKLYEVLKRDHQKNAGIMGGTIPIYVLQDVHSYDDPFTVTQAEFEKYTSVHPQVEHDIEDLLKDLERWAERAPAWMD